MIDQAKDTPNLAELSDEEVLNMDPDRFPDPTEESIEASDSQPTPEEVSETEDSYERESRSEQYEEPDAPGEDDSEDEGSEVPDLRDVYYADGESADDETDEEATQPVDEPTAEADSEVDPEAELQRLFAPFKAAKREMRVTNIEDARRLMQMGVDYSRKMESIKPYQKALKTLERHNLLSPEKINFLIDLVDKKNPDAIRKFLKDSDIDPLDLSTHDEEDDGSYRPNDYTIGDQDLLLDEIIDELQGTDSFNRTVEEITNKWDDASRGLVKKDPNLIRVINDHVAVGIYDQIMNVVEQERLMGRLSGLSDLEAYKAVGDAINAKGGFKPYQSRGPLAGQTSQVSGSRAAKQAAQLRKRKAAASPTRGTSGRSKEVKNFLEALSDDEIEAMGPSIL
jgi:hypothetical protein